MAMLLRMTPVLVALALPVIIVTVSSAGDEWRVIESVLTHPRCINCHTATDYPRQGDDRHIHQFRVVRGPDDRGAPGADNRWPCATRKTTNLQAAFPEPRIGGSRLRRWPSNVHQAWRW